MSEAALVAPVKYTSMVWAVLFEFLFFGDLSDAWTLLGVGTISRTLGVRPGAGGDSAAVEGKAGGLEAHEQLI